MLFHELDFNATMDWSFFETAHGKGAVDGVGGTVKLTVWLAVLRNKVVVRDAEKFASVAKDLCNGINVIYVPAATTKESTSHFEEQWKDCNPLPQTLKVHFVKPVDKFTIAASVNTTYYPSAVLNQHQLLAPPSPRLEDSPVETHEQAHSSGYSQETEMELSSDGSDGEESNEIDLNVGQWYAVYFGDYNYLYVGILCNLKDNQVELNFLQQGNIGKNIFSNEEDDIHTVKSSDVF